MRPASPSRKCPSSAPSESGRIVCAVETSWNSGRSLVSNSGSVPTITAAAQSPKIAWLTSESK